VIIHYFSHVHVSRLLAWNRTVFYSALETEFSAKISESFKNLQILLIFVPNFERSL